MSTASAQPSTEGPMTMPPRIRNSTWGGRPGTSRETIGASAATVITSNSDHSELSLIDQRPSSSSWPTRPELSGFPARFARTGGARRAAR